MVGTWQAIGTYAKQRGQSTVVTARDGRISGPDLQDALNQGLIRAGIDVIDVGMVPTPVLYFAALTLGTGSGVMVTGSHNPPDYNGFKMMIGGHTLYGDDITALYDAIESDNLVVGEGSISETDALTPYFKQITGDVQLKKPLKVAIDCGNGVQASVLKHYSSNLAVTWFRFMLRLRKLPKPSSRSIQTEKLSGRDHSGENTTL